MASEPSPLEMYAANNESTGNLDGITTSNSKSSGGSSTSTSKTSKSISRSNTSDPRTPFSPFPVTNIAALEKSTEQIANAMLGSNKYNGFNQTLSCIQRIKKQRILSITRFSREKTANKNTPVVVDEMSLAPTILNANTIKKMKDQYQAGIDFCDKLKKQVANVTNYMYKNNMVKDILVEGGEVKGEGGGVWGGQMETMSTAGDDKGNKKHALGGGGGDEGGKKKKAKVAQAGRKELVAQQIGGGVQLRKDRKSKVVPNTISPLKINDDLLKTLTLEEDIEYLKQIDEKYGRKITKKEACRRGFEISRFRPLFPGDLCCCKNSPSDDHWMLGKVMKEWNPPEDVSYKSIVNMDVVTRNSILAMVCVMDVDNSSGGPPQMHSLHRSTVLPLPRNHLEAAQWGQRFKKTNNILAIYPDTTSLYPAMALDNTTYCNGDDDIIECVFNDDGGVHRYVLARHCTLYPEEDEKGGKSQASQESQES